jgi:small GTP-binding protein
MSGLIAIVGRPNVGKSALFNRIAGKRIAIVHDMPGVTRDRITAEAEWFGRPFTLVDTGGIGLLRREKSPDVIVGAAIDQVNLAIESANVIILVVNVQEGVVPLDREVATRLRACGKPVLVAINKVDNYKSEQGVPEFTRLGFEKMFPLSAIHGGGITDLMDEAIKHVGGVPTAAEREAAAALELAEAEKIALAPRKEKNPHTQGTDENCHRWPPQRRQILHHQRAHRVRTRHRQSDPRHHARFRGCAVRGGYGWRAAVIHPH